MLEMLMIHPEHIISSNQFMEKIWGFDSEAEINVVWVYISNLRKIESTRRKCSNQSKEKYWLLVGGNIMAEKLRRKFILVSVGAVSIWSLRLLF